MVKILISLALISVFEIVLSVENQAALDIVKRNYEDSLLKLAGEQVSDLKQFKLILSKDKSVDINDPFQKISDDVLSKNVVKFLVTKSVDSTSEEKFVSDCEVYLEKPCETLRSIFKVSLVFYYARVYDKDLKSVPNHYDSLQTAGICDTLVKSTDSICKKSHRYLLEHKKSGLLGKLSHCFGKNC